MINFDHNFDRNFDRYFDKMVNSSFGGGGGKQVLVLLSACVERFDVSRMRDFFFSTQSVECIISNVSQSVILSVPHPLDYLGDVAVIFRNGQIIKYEVIDPKC